MPVKSKKLVGLTGNQLKIIALIAMTIDHIGVQILPQYTFLRVIGRLSFPIFAYMIAEGCRYTSNKKKYLLTILAAAALCQIVFYITTGSLYQCILVTFSLSVILIFALDHAQRRKSLGAWLFAIIAFLAVVFLSVCLPQFLPDTDYAIDYGIWGIFVPVFFYCGNSKRTKLLLGTVSLCLLAIRLGSIQWYSLAAVLLLLLYNGNRGKYKMKYLFYIYYPLHLAAIYGISLLL